MHSSAGLKERHATGRREKCGAGDVIEQLVRRREGARPDPVHCKDSMRAVAALGVDEP
jgi:hypothetical protein